MGDKVGALKTLVVPAVISLILFLFLTFVIVPIWRRYRTRYSQYIPIDAITEQTTSLRHRITHRIFRAFLPSTWRRDRELLDSGRGAGLGISVAGGFGRSSDLEDGEELDEIDEATAQILDRHSRVISGPDNARRLSRDLEEGFMDSSDSSSDSSD